MAPPSFVVDEDISAAFGVPKLRARCFTPAALAAVRAIVADGTLGLEQRKARLKKLSLDPSEVVFQRAVQRPAEQQDEGCVARRHERRAQQGDRDARRGERKERREAREAARHERHASREAELEGRPRK